MTRNSKLAIALVVLVVWAVITMAGATLQTGGQVSLEQLVSVRLVYSLVAAAAFLAAVAAWLHWDRLGFQRPRPARAQLSLWLPLLYIAALLGLAASKGLPAPGVIGFVLINTLFVGFSEELMFRGILFRGALAKFRIWPALLLTSVVFGLIHTLNVFLTGEAMQAMVQAAAAFMSGIFYIAIRIRSQSLYPMIVVHWIWDFSTLIGATTGNAQPGASLSTMTTIAGPIVLVAPLFLYGLYLLRHVQRDFGAMSDVSSGSTPRTDATVHAVAP